MVDVEVAAAVAELADWQVVDGKLAREFRFADFVQAIEFIDRVAVEAEALDHHPEWSNVYKTVNVTLTTHEAGGLTQRDIALAEAMDRIAAAT